MRSNNLLHDHAKFTFFPINVSLLIWTRDTPSCEERYKEQTFLDFLPFWWFVHGKSITACQWLFFFSRLALQLRAGMAISRVPEKEAPKPFLPALVLWSDDSYNRIKK